MTTRRILAIAAIGFAAGAALADTEVVGGIEWTYEIVGGKAAVFNNNYAAIPSETVGAITIPSTLGGCPVTRIGNYAFECCYDITRVTIPAGVTEIADHAFSNCTSLESVSIPSSVTRIGEGAFYWCAALKLTVPNTVTEVGDYAFEGCDAMANANGFVIVRNVLHWYAGSAATLTVPSGVTRISHEAFQECHTLKSVTVPASVTYIGPYAFYNCNMLQNVVYLGTLPEVGYNIYSGTPGELVSIVPASGWATALAEGKWQDRLIRVATPSGKATVFFCSDSDIGICDSPFKVVAKGATVGTLPTVTSSSHRFVGWFTARDGGTQVTPATQVNVDVTYYARWTKNEETVGGITWKYSVEGGEAMIFNANYAAIPSDTSGAITIPSTLGGCPVTTIGPYAFEYCEALTRVTIPGSVRNIEHSAFTRCVSLESVTIPNTVTNIGDYAFHGCAALKSANVPASVVTVGDAVFAGCDALADANGFVIVRNILHNYCGAATAVTVPSSVMRIGSSAFEGRSAVKGVVIPDSVLSLGHDVFFGCTSLASVTLPEGLLEIGIYAFQDCTSLTSITIPSSVVRLESCLFHNCSSLETVTFCGSALIENNLYPCTSDYLKSVVPAAGWENELAAGIWCERSIRVTPGSTGKWTDSAGVEWTYRKMNGKAEIFKAHDTAAIPAGTSGAITVPATLGGCPVTRIGDSAFSECRSITAVTVPASVKSIGQMAFYHCEGLKSVTLSNGLTSLDQYAFYCCSSLKEITIPASVRHISYGALSDCGSLKTVTYLGPCPQGACMIDDVGIYDYSPEDLVSVVSATAGGWERVLAAGEWQGRDIRTAASGPSVTFNAQGGKFSNGAATKTVTATPGNLWGKLPMPAKDGQVFDGWYTAASGGTMITASSTVPTASTTYYAHWTPRLGLAAASEWGGAFETDSWCGQGTVAHDEKDALRSGIIYNNQSSYIRTKVTGAGTLSFWWAVSCEAGGNDKLCFLVDGVQKKYISGERDWANVTFAISGAGEHTIEWRYTKNATVTKGEDFGWVDQISWAATPAESAFVFDANGGKFSNGASVKKTDATPGNLWGKMYMPAKDGQVFVGWYTAKDGGQLVTSSSVVPNSYTTYYAHWTPRLGLAAASEWGGAFETDSWCGQGAVSHDGKDALRSGILYDNQSSYVLTRVTGPGTFTFWWKVSCEGGGNDKLRFLVDGVQKGTITGESDWAKVTVSVTGTGTHILKWVYSKNSTVTKGQDFGWLDQLNWQAK